MLQPKLFFKDYTYDSGHREADSCRKGIKYPNSLLLAEGEGVTATSLGNLCINDQCKEIYRKNAPNELFLVLITKKGV